MKKILVILLIFPLHLIAQEHPSLEFWNSLKQHCGKSYKGKVTNGGKEGDGFVGEELIMHISSCETNIIRIPFFVGENKSRTWVLSMQKGNKILLKHDHRDEEGHPEETTQYGGMSPNTGMSNLQMFPADQETAELLPAAATNVWWLTIDEDTFTYNLRRVGSARIFSVTFNLLEEVESPGPAWGWDE